MPPHCCWFPDICLFQPFKVLALLPHCFLVGTLRSSHIIPFLVSESSLTISYFQFGLLCPLPSSPLIPNPLAPQGLSHHQLPPRTLLVIISHSCPKLPCSSSMYYLVFAASEYFQLFSEVESYLSGGTMPLFLPFSLTASNNG